MTDSHPGPCVRGLRVRGRVVCFTLSGAARVRLAVARAGRVVRRLTVRGRVGANRMVLPALRRGRYRVAVGATDAAGNAGALASRAFGVRIRR